MLVHSVRFTNPDRDQIEVASDLGDFYLSWPCRSWHRQAIQVWLDAGNKIRPFRPETDVEAVRGTLIREVYQQAARLLDGVTAEYAIPEQIIWPDLEREARRFMLDGTQGPLMQAELVDEGRSAEELAYAVVHKANRLAKYRGAVIAARAVHVKRINAADLTALEGYESGADWPIPPEK